MVEASFFDEMWGNDEQLRPPYKKFQSWFNGEDPKRLRSKQREAEELFRLTGITFNVYGRSEAEERLIPFDIIPRVISEREWARVTRASQEGSNNAFEQSTPFCMIFTTNKRSSRQAAFHAK